MITDIPSARTVDYCDADEICGYQMLLCKMFEKAGGLGTGRVSDKEIAAIRREGMSWLKEVRGHIDDLFSSTVTPDKEKSRLALGDLPRILGSYDFFYRICHGAPCFGYLRKLRMMAADRYVKGDRSISQVQVALMLLAEIKRDIRSMQQRYIDFSFSVMKSWIKDLELHSRLRDMPLRDAYDVLSYLLKENLSAFILNSNSKLRWIKAYTLKEDRIDTLDTPTLRSYIGFERTSESFTEKSLSEQDANYVCRFSKLSTRPDIHPFIKEGIALDLARYQTA